mmetsp:Transcript_11028/g.32957  ORF Transcript_11028/g.32957 Transcript_11028/m.32957 type:complete len:473 (+) Transcript_11028:3-1421(+)
MATQDSQNETFLGRIKDAVPVAEKKKFTVYLIEVTPPWFYNVPSYTIHRRYREFLALYKELCVVFGKATVGVTFPKKKALGSMGASTVKHRKVALQAFFDVIAANERMGKHKLMQDFFAHRPGADPPKPGPGTKGVSPGGGGGGGGGGGDSGGRAAAADDAVFVAGSKRKGAAVAMRVAAATPGQPASTNGAAPGAPATAPPADHELDRANAPPSKVRAEAEAAQKAERERAKAEAERVRAEAEAERKLRAAEEKERIQAEAAKREKEKADRKAEAAAERRASLEAERQAAEPASPRQPVSPTAAAASTAARPAAAATATADNADRPALPALSAKLLADAEKCLSAGDFAGASEGFDEAAASLEDSGAEFYPARCEMVVKRAECLLHDGKARDATEDCSTMLELCPNHSELLLRRAKAYQQREKFRDAFNDYQACVLQKQKNEQNARRGLREVIKMLEQMGEGSWVRKNRKV